MRLFRKFREKYFPSKKGIKMDFKDKTLEEIKVELSTKDFMWKKGDHMGKMERYSNIIQEGDLKFVEFTEEGRMNLALLDEFMDIFPATKANFINPKQELIQPITNINQVAQPRNTVVSSATVEDSPIYTLLKKQKTNWVNVTLNLKLNLPTKNLYSVLTNSFDTADEEIVNYITEGMDIEDIKGALGDTIRDYYGRKKEATIMSNTEENEE